MDVQVVVSHHSEDVNKDTNFVVVSDGNLVKILISLSTIDCVGKIDFTSRSELLDHSKSFSSDCTLGLLSARTAVMSAIDTRVLRKCT